MKKCNTSTINERKDKTMTRTELMIYAQQEYDKAICNHSYKEYSRLNQCQAHYVDTGKAVILRSYNTIVAIFSKEVGSLYVFDYYSPTTVQHISKFAKMLSWDRIVYLYKRSDNTIEKNIGPNHVIKKYKVSGIARYNLDKTDYSLEITNRWD